LDAFAKGGELISNTLREESIKQSGTLILPMPEKIMLTIFYEIDYKAGRGAIKSNLNGLMIAFLQKKDVPGPHLYFCNQFENNFRTSYFSAENDLDEGHQIAFYIGLILFPNFCEVETKLVPPGTKSSCRFENYINDTELPIEILDSTWFTTIVRSEAFTVGGKDGGFYRWQRFGPGLSEKKIIWVPAFEKKGYTRYTKDGPRAFCIRFNIGGNCVPHFDLLRCSKYSPTGLSSVCQEMSESQSRM
jgi:hypothetical protein